MENTNLLDIVFNAADDKRAEDIVVLNMEGISPITDHVVICHANSERQVQSIAREIKNKAGEEGFHYERIEGFDGGRWVLVDLGDVVAHVFHRDDRSYYNLERLWGDAPEEYIEADYFE